jgi:hypothetical protein
MNEVLRRFVLVFFDDILIYSPTWTEPLQHVRVVFQVLRDNKLAIKQSKCSFGAQEVAYLGHIISNSGIAMDPAKIDVVQSWPTPTMSRALRGFLGLTGYYRKFLRDYGTIARPLTQLLKREAFVWSPGERRLPGAQASTHIWTDDAAARLRRAVHRQL